MKAIQFTTVVGPDGVIRPPTGVALPSGTVEVIVRPGITQGEVSELPAPSHDWLLALAKEVEQAAPNLPADLAEQHDHYAHGKPRS
jgi:hypothetical protein